MIDQLPVMDDPATVDFKRRVTVVFALALTAWLLFGCAFYGLIRWTKGS